jgi:hypothetical protein
MPGENKKGPMGEGPQTGRGLGKCNDNQTDSTEAGGQPKPRRDLDRDRGPGQGRGLGRGPGGGMGRGRGLGRRGGGRGGGR